MLEMALNTSGPSYCESKGEMFAWEADHAAADDKKFFKRYFSLCLSLRCCGNLNSCLLVIIIIIL